MAKEYVIPAFIECPEEGSPQDGFIPITEPLAAESAKDKLQRLRTEIQDCILIMALHGKDFAQEWKSLVKWGDRLVGEVEKRKFTIQGTYRYLERRR